MTEPQSVTNDIFKGIAAILWFFYRVLYTMVTTAFFVGLLYFFLLNNDKRPKELTNWLYDFFDFDSGNQFLILFIFIAFLNIVLEAFVIRIAYRILGFESFCAKLFSTFFYERVSPKLKQMRSPVPFFGLINTYSLSKDTKVYEHSQYLLAREYLFNNSWILILVTATFIFPSLVSYDKECLALVIPVQFLIACFIAWGSMALIKYTKFNLENMLFNEDQELTLKIIKEELKHELEVKSLIEINEKYFNGEKKEPVKNKFLKFIQKIVNRYQPLVKDYTKDDKMSLIKDVIDDTNEKFNELKRRKDFVNISLTLLFALSLFLIIYPFECYMNSLLLLGIDIATFIFCYFLMSAAFREYVNVELVTHFYYLNNKKEIDENFKSI